MKVRGLTFECLFIKRLNRFLALVEVNGEREYCHVRDPGRLTEVLVPNSKAIVRSVEARNRKTKFELVAVKRKGIWIVVNSGLHGQLAEELIESGKIKELAGLRVLRREWRYGDSRFDFLLSNEHRYLLEVKGCTLARNGLALFPDAPTKRGAKQLKTLLTAMREGFRVALLILIMRRDVKIFSPNMELDPIFSDAFNRLLQSGAIVAAYSFDFDGSEIKPYKRIPVKSVKSQS